jgi:hypothetical protein
VELHEPITDMPTGFVEPRICLSETFADVLEEASCDAEIQSFGLGGLFQPRHRATSSSGVNLDGSGPFAWGMVSVQWRLFPKPDAAGARS